MVYVATLFSNKNFADIQHAHNAFPSKYIYQYVFYKYERIVDTIGYFATHVTPIDFWMATNSIEVSIAELVQHKHLDPSWEWPGLKPYKGDLTKPESRTEIHGIVIDRLGNQSYCDFLIRRTTELLDRVPEIRRFTQAYGYKFDPDVSDAELIPLRGRFVAVIGDMKLQFL